jgi:hypothetical protein
VAPFALFSASTTLALKGTPRPAFKQTQKHRLIFVLVAAVEYFTGWEYFRYVFDHPYVYQAPRRPCFLMELRDH